MKQRSRRQVEDVASQVLASLGVSKPPVDVERLARRLGYQVVFQHFRDEISGTVMRDDDGSITIGINTFHPETRRRFSVAHEIGHAQLHGTDLKDKPIVDPPARVLFRDGKASLGEDPLEIQANQFAAALLMPREFVTGVGQRLIDRNPKISGTELVEALARRFEVSTQAMRYRLVTFGVLEPD